MTTSSRGGEFEEPAAAVRVALFLTSLATLLLVAWMLTAQLAFGALAQSAWLAFLAPHVWLAVTAPWLRGRGTGLAAMLAGATGLAGLLVVLAKGHALTLVIAYLAVYPVLSLGLVAAQVALLSLGHAVWKRRPVPRARTAVFAFTCLTTLGAIGTTQSLWLWRSARQRAARPEATPFPVSPGQLAEGSLNLTLPCLFRYANRNGAFPERISEIGPQGNACVPAKYAPEQIPGYRVTYEARADSGGDTRTLFWLRYEPQDAASRTYGTFLADETAMVYRGIDAAGRPERPVEGQRGLVGRLQECVEMHRLWNSRPGYAQHLEEVGRYGRMMCLDRMGPERDAPNLAGRLYGYVVRYTPEAPDAAGNITAYRMDARPVVYGRPYVRSYMCGPSGAIHETDEDRPAEETDSNLDFDEAFHEPRPSPCRSAAAYAELHRQAQAASGRR